MKNLFLVLVLAICCDACAQDKHKAAASFDPVLAAQLDSIFTDDQQGRMLVEPVERQKGFDSKEVKEMWAEINRKDSINVIKVCNILDTRGWPGPDVVSLTGAQALFLVIQHANIRIQEKYQPMMRDAVKDHRAQPSALALLEDRVALREGRKQIYGSQVGMDNGKYYLSPLEDPDHVDERRASVGLQPLANYLAHWNLVWDVEVYKKQLPQIEKLEKEQRIK